MSKNKLKVKTCTEHHTSVNNPIDFNPPTNSNFTAVLFAYTEKTNITPKHNIPIPPARTARPSIQAL